MYKIKQLQSGRSKIIIGVVMVFIFVSTLFFGLAHIANMNIFIAEIGCPFSLESGSVCPIELSEHIISWQNLSLATPLILFLLLLIAPFVRTLIIVCSRFFKQLLQAWKLLTLISLNQLSIYIPVPNYLEESFSSGILHTKRF